MADPRFRHYRKQFGSEVRADRHDRQRFQELLGSVERGEGLTPDELAEATRLYPRMVATTRRKARLEPVRVAGSRERGRDLGYFQTRLRDGTLGYSQRRTDDCLQAAIASLLQIPMCQVPDLRIDRQLASGLEPDEMERNIAQTMRRWTTERGLTVLLHPTMPTSARRWIGVTRVEDDLYSDHCLLMSGRDCLFDPYQPIPDNDDPWGSHEFGDLDYGITIEKR